MDKHTDDAHTSQSKLNDTVFFLYACMQQQITGAFCYKNVAILYTLYFRYISISPLYCKIAAF